MANETHACKLSDDISDKITLVIPTHERPKLLTRSLGYHSCFGSKIIVADSSAEAQDSLAKLSKRVDYLWKPGGIEVYAAKVVEALERVDTELVVLIPDDDFLVVSGLEKCTRNMLSHSGPSASQGVHFRLVEARRPFASPYEWNGGSTSTAENRLQEAFGSFLYSVQRTEDLLAYFRLVEESELLTLGLPVGGLVDGTHTAFFAVKGSLEVIEEPFILRSLEVGSTNASGERTSLLLRQEVTDFLEKALETALADPDDCGREPVRLGSVEAEFWSRARRDLAGQILFASRESEAISRWYFRLARRFSICGRVLRRIVWLRRSTGRFRVISAKFRQSSDWKEIRAIVRESPRYEPRRVRKG